MLVRSVAALMLAVEIAIHTYLAPDHLAEMPYIGVGFVIASVLCAVALVPVLLDRPAGWLLGATLCVGMAGLFALSRAVGLPDYHEAWTSDASLGLWSLLPEVAFVLLAWVRLRTGVSPSPRRMPARALGGAGAATGLGDSPLAQNS